MQMMQIGKCWGRGDDSVLYVRVQTVSQLASAMYCQVVNTTPMISTVTVFAI